MSGTHGNGPADVLHTHDGDEYRRLLKEEEEYWDEREDTPCSRTQLPKIQAYMNERFTGRPDVEWHQVISEYASFRRGCILGAGPGQVEADLLQRNPGLELLVLDISNDALGRLHAKLEESFPGRVEVRRQDLNFVELPENTYDLAVANSSMHHLVNLEHVAYQINRSLTEDGYFFMRDTVGESYFQYDEEKKRLFELVNNASMSPWFRRTVEWADRDHWQLSPFESVRSADILEVLRRYLREESVRTAWALLALGMFTRDARPEPRQGLTGRLISALRRRLFYADELREIARLQTMNELFLEIDRILCDTGCMTPGLAFAVYRKR